MTVIEKVARAVVAHMRTIDPTMTSWDEATDDMRKFMHDLARAAIEAMREPTYDMRFGDDVKEWPEDAAACWKAMIDAALAEEPK